MPKTTASSKQIAAPDERSADERTADERSAAAPPAAAFITRLRERAGEDEQHDRAVYGAIIRQAAAGKAGAHEAADLADVARRLGRSEEDIAADIELIHRVLELERTADRIPEHEAAIAEAKARRDHLTQQLREARDLEWEIRKAWGGVSVAHDAIQQARAGAGQAQRIRAERPELFPPDDDAGDDPGQ